MEWFKKTLCKAIRKKYRSKKMKKSEFSTKAIGLGYYTIKGVNEHQIKREIQAERFTVEKIIVKLDNPRTDGAEIKFIIENLELPEENR